MRLIIKNIEQYEVSTLKCMKKFSSAHSFISSLAVFIALPFGLLGGVSAITYTVYGVASIIGLL